MSKEKLQQLFDQIWQFKHNERWPYQKCYKDFYQITMVEYKEPNWINETLNQFNVLIESQAKTIKLNPDCTNSEQYLTNLVEEIERFLVKLQRINFISLRLCRKLSTNRNVILNQGFQVLIQNILIANQSNIIKHFQILLGKMFDTSLQSNHIQTLQKVLFLCFTLDCKQPEQKLFNTFVLESVLVVAKSKSNSIGKLIFNFPPEESTVTRWHQCLEQVNFVWREQYAIKMKQLTQLELRKLFPLFLLNQFNVSECNTVRFGEFVDELIECTRKAYYEQTVHQIANQLLPFVADILVQCSIQEEVEQKKNINEKDCFQLVQYLFETVSSPSTSDNSQTILLKALLKFTMEKFELQTKLADKTTPSGTENKSPIKANLNKVDLLCGLELTFTKLLKFSLFENVDCAELIRMQMFDVVNSERLFPASDKLYSIGQCLAIYLHKNLSSIYGNRTNDFTNLRRCTISPKYIPFLIQIFKKTLKSIRTRCTRIPLSKRQILVRVLLSVPPGQTATCTICHLDRQRALRDQPDWLGARCPVQ